MNKELEKAFKIVRSGGIGYTYDEYSKAVDIVENALKEHEQEQDQKKLKTLEIIKEKMVNVGDFIRCKSVEDYNDYCCYNEKEQLTKEEYNLLKGVLL